MNTPQTTRRPRAALAIKGARRARMRTLFTQIIGRQLDIIAPGTIRVRITPVTVAGRPRTHVVLESATGTVPADLDAHRYAYRMLGRAFPDADWTRPRTYDARTGVLAVDEPTAPAALGLDPVEGAGQ